VTFSVRPQVAHSKVRSSNPRAPGVMRARAILCLQTGHIGRSFGELTRLTPALDVHTLCRMGGGFQSRSERQCRGRIGPAGRAKMPACVASPPSPRPQRRGRAQESRFAGAMTNDDEFYRRQAREAEEQAQRARSDLDRQTWLRIARDWWVSCADGPRVTTTASPRNRARCQAALLLFKHNLEIPLRERWTTGRKQVISRHCQQSVVRRGACPEFSDYSSKSFSRPS
jgi:hypothetical protein